MFIFLLFASLLWEISVSSISYLFSGQLLGSPLILGIYPLAFWKGSEGEKNMTQLDIGRQGPISLPHFIRNTKPLSGTFLKYIHQS